MNALNILSAFVRAAVLKGREKRRLAQKPLFPTQSQAPEDEFWNLSVQLLGYHSEENCAIKYEVNTRYVFYYCSRRVCNHLHLIKIMESCGYS